ncbi:hypothetical protein HBH71_247770 [Parastagonospora nodorum]|nr:hypothetical protein HBH71_247770 [Parastagonospora nodorum]
MTKENALTITLIKDDDDLLGTVNSHIKLRRLRARRKTEAADSRHAKASGGRTKKDKDLEDFDTSSDVLRLRRRDRAAARAQLAKRKHPLDSDDYCLDSSSDINSKDNLEDKEATTAKDLLTTIYSANKQTRTRDSLSARVETAIEHYAYILYFKELLSNNSRIFTNAIGMKVQNTRAEGDAIEYNAVNNNDKLCPTKGERTFYCANSPSENIGRPTKEEAIEMQINTTNAISKALAAANKLVALQSYVLGGALSGTPIEQGLNEILIFFNATNKRDSITSDRIYKIEDAVYQSITETLSYRTHFLSTVQNAKQQCRDILEKEGLNKSEASRRVIFNRFKMQAIVSYSALATLKVAQFKTYSSCKVKRFTLNSIKDLFTNLSKDYFLVQEARAITKSSLKFQNLSNLCSKSIAAEDAAKAANTLLLLKKVRAKILIGSYKPIVQAIIVALIAFAEAITLTEATHVIIIELQDRQNTQDQFIIVYFNPDSKLELKVLGKQNVKTTS